MVYKWKDDAVGPTSKIKANDVGKILEKLDRTHGRATPEAILKEAKPKNSPIHNWFEWDNTEAARKHREWQARSLVQQITIIYKNTGKTKPQTVRAFVSIVENNHRHYVSTARVLSNIDLRNQAIDDVEDQIRYCENKLKAFNGFSRALILLKKARTQLQKSKRRRGAA